MSLLKGAHFGIVAAALLCGPQPANGQPAEQVCKTSTWSNCGLAIKQELDKKPADPKRVVQLAAAWGESFGARFNSLRKQGRVEQSTPDSEKIFDEINSKLNPVEIAKDKALEAILKRYLAFAATALEWAEKPLAVALKAFFDSSEIATDWDELRLMNDDIQKRVAVLLAPHMRTDWKERLNAAAQAAGPQLRRP